MKSRKRFKYRTLNKPFPPLARLSPKSLGWRPISSLLFCWYSLSMVMAASPFPTEPVIRDTTPAAPPVGRTEEDGEAPLLLEEGLKSSSPVKQRKYLQPILEAFRFKQELISQIKPRSNSTWWWNTPRKHEWVSCPTYPRCDQADFWLRSQSPRQTLRVLGQLPGEELLILYLFIYLLIYFICIPPFPCGLRMVTTQST